MGRATALESGARVPTIARGHGVIAAGQIVGDINHETDLFTTFTRLGGATENTPTDRIIYGIDQTALFPKDNTFSRYARLADRRSGGLREAIKPERGSVAPSSIKLPMTRSA
jgi:hypothetical protein